MRTIRFIIGNLDHFKSRFWMNMVVGFVDGILVFLIPVLLAEFTKSDFTIENLSVLAGYLLACYVGSLILQWITRRSGESLALQYGNYLRLKYFKIIEDLDVGELHKNHTGYLFSLVNTLGDASAHIVSGMFWLIAHSAANLSLFFIFTAKESLILAVFNAGVLIIFVIISLRFSRAIVPLATVHNLRHARLVEKFIDLVSNIFTIQKLGIYDFAEDEMRSHVAKNADQIRVIQKFEANRWFALHGVFGVAFLATLFFLLFRVTSNKIEPSIIILFIAAFSTVRGNIENLSEFIKEMLQHEAYVRNLESIAGKVEKDRKFDLSLTLQKIEMSDISFQHQDSNNLIRIPSFEFSSGECLCIAGESGQGKSTFLNILTHFIDPCSGSRILNDLPFEQFSRFQFRKMMGFVSQEVELFKMSVRDNLCLGKKISDDRIIEVLNGMNLGEWYSSLAYGLDTVVGEKGVKLSAGQKQRINIARCLLLDRSILIFDEPTSHLDEYTENKVIAYLKDNLRGKSAVFVSHRPAIEKLCSRKYVFENHEMHEVK